MLAVAGPDGLCVLEFSDRRALERELEELRSGFSSAILPGAHPALDVLERELDGWFAGTLVRFTVPLAPRGTPFERAVWDRLAAIPYVISTFLTRNKCAVASGPISTYEYSSGSVRSRISFSTKVIATSSGGA